MTDPSSLRPDSSGDDGDLLVVARLRSALDEVAAGLDLRASRSVGTTPETLEVRIEVGTGDQSPMSVHVAATPSRAIPNTVTALPSKPAGPRAGTDARRTRPVAWLGVAAACTALVGGATWALAQRQPTAPVASPDPAVSPIIASGDPTDDVVPPSSLAPISSTVSIAAPVGSSEEPWFTLASENLIPGRVTRPAPVESASDPMFQSWHVSDDGGGGDDGFLFARISAADGVSDTPDNSERVEEITTIRTGRAWLLAPEAGTEASSTDGTQVFWARDDGSVWLFDSQGLSTGAVERLVVGAEAGSGVPIVLTSPAGRISLLAVGPASSTVTGQSYLGSAGGSVDLTVTDGAAAPTALLHAVTVDEVSVAGSTGWMGRYADGHVEVVWDAGGGWWGLLGISADLSDNADGIVAAVSPGDAASLGPRPPMLPADATYRVVAAVSDDPNGIVAIVPDDSAYQARVGLTGFSWSDVTDERLVNGALRGGPYEMIVHWDGYTFDLVDLVDLVGPADESATTPGCPVDVAELDTVMDELPALDSLALGIISYGYDTTDGDCTRLQLNAHLDTPELDEALAPYADRLTIDYVLTPLAA